MEALLIYLAKSASLLTVFYFAYIIFLRRETFFKSNRWYFIAGLVTSLVLPLVTFKKIVWVEPVALDTKHWVMLPMQAASAYETAPTLDWYQLLFMAYLTGVLIFSIQFIIDLLALHRLLKGKEWRDVHGFKFIDTTEKVSPFSYFGFIVYNSAMYTAEELANILEHEKVHSAEKHTIDVLLSRLFCIAFWFNPFMWLYKKCIVQNLEFIADHEASKRITDIKSYQLTLLKITTHESCVAVTNHFYQSLIKKRIVMLNKNQSKRRNSWKYAVVLPALIAFILGFQVKVIAQEKTSDPVAVDKKVEVRVLKSPGTEVVVDKKTSDTELKAYADKLKQEGITLKFSKVKRNNSGEITRIKAEFKDKTGKKGATMVEGDEPIKPLSFYKSENAIGFGAPRMRVLRGHAADGDDHRFVYSFDTDDIIADIPDVSTIIDLKDLPEIPGFPVAPAHPEFRELHNGLQRSRVYISKDNAEPIVIVDGKVVSGEISENELEKLQSDRVRVIVDSKKISRDAMERAREAMEKAGPEMELAREKILEQLDRSRTEREKNRSISREDMERAKEEIEKAREEITKAREEIRKARMELDNKSGK